MDLIERIREAQHRWNVLRHPFYERWDAGALSADELRFYAGQYGHAVAAVAHAARASATYGTPEHAAEEAAHVMLWDAFTHAVGADPTAEATPETAACAESWAPQEALAATAVLYAVESAQPPIAETKLRGLVAHYGFRDDSPALAYFHVHAERDDAHGARAERILHAEASAEDEDRLVAAAEAALRGNWLLLDGVERAG
ncbi:MAG: iron-containing redox enzyme family protein [Thermoleophilia bacterium]|nr:iron-containing redox enzyme family protein [Thermoleophilia bacterium]